MRASVRPVATALVVVALALAARGASAGTLADQLERIGPPRPPAYVRANELLDAKKLRFAEAPDRQSAARGGAERIVLDPAVGHYLWAIDVDGGFHIAPYRRLPGGGENIGHPMLLGGKPARLAGELRLVSAGGKRARWVLDNDSGRYVRPYGVTHPRQLRAARALLLAIGVSDVGGRALHLGIEVVAPIDDAELAQLAKTQPARARAIRRARRGRGPTIIPEKGTERARVAPRARR